MIINSQIAHKINPSSAECGFFNVKKTYVLLLVLTVFV